MGAKSRRRLGRPSECKGANLAPTITGCIGYQLRGWCGVERGVFWGFAAPPVLVGILTLAWAVFG